MPASPILTRPLRIAVLLLALLPAAAAAQSGLLVKVTGHGQAVSGATVSVSLSGQVLWSVLSDSAGRARVAGIAAGTYEVHVDAAGYKPGEARVRVEAGEVKVLPIELQLAPIQLESIGVVADRVKVQVQTTEVKTTVDEVAINLLPVAHDADKLVALTPGARPGHVWGGANYQADSYLLDGLSVNHPGMGGDLIQPSIDWIDKVEVRGLGAGAEFGGFQGGIVNIVTKSGTNDVTGLFRSSVENAALNRSNLVSTEIGTEVATRYDFEGQVGGPVLRDRLFYFISGERIQRDARVLNHLGIVDGHYSPTQEARSDDKYFGKLTWTPSPSTKAEVSGGYLNVAADNYGMTGYEDAGAAWRYTSPTWFGTGMLRRTIGSWGNVEARFNRFSRDERSDPYNGTDVPGVRTFALTPPYTAFQNAPYRLRSAPASTSGSLIGTFRLKTGSLEHLLKVGGEYTRGSFLDERVRNGGMTWLPTLSSRFDPADPSTWSHVSTSFIAAEYGGEVHLNADIVNEAAFAQSSISLGPRIVFSPGVRWGRWQGFMDPAGQERFLAVQDEAVDPRVGLAAKLTGDGTLLAKVHWGRYHQNMIGQMFDRVQGANVFTNDEVWFYRGDAFSDPATRFSAAQRDSLAALGQFTQETVQILNETGPVLNYRQPYIDEWLFSMEKQFGSSVKMQALYTHRANRNMIALVDLNRATNYTHYKSVRVYDSSGGPLPFSGGQVFLKDLYIPNNAMIDRIRFCAINSDVCSIPPGMTAADTLSLTWDPAYRLTTAPDAKRDFGQVQLSLDVARPTWGASLSAVFTSLKGNLDNVSGYADPNEYGAGQYVHVNEGVDAYGILSNFSTREAKVSVWGQLPWQLRGGMFWRYATGDHYAPRFRLSSQGYYTYRINTNAPRNGSYRPGQEPSSTAGQTVDYNMFGPLEGQYVFIGPRGKPQMDTRSNLDLRIDRTFDWTDYQVAVSLDVFNVLGASPITELNTMVNNGPDYYGFLGSGGGSFPNNLRSPANQFYQAPLERAPGRTLRLGMEVTF